MDSIPAYLLRYVCTYYRYARHGAGREGKGREGLVR